MSSLSQALACPYQDRKPRAIGEGERGQVHRQALRVVLFQNGADRAAQVVRAAYVEFAQQLQN